MPLEGVLAILNIMPFKSKAQWRYMYAKHPKIAKRWAHHTKRGYKKLPGRKR